MNNDGRLPVLAEEVFEEGMSELGSLWIYDLFSRRVFLIHVVSDSSEILENPRFKISIIHTLAHRTPS
jgi:hypothetical protein